MITPPPAPGRSSRDHVDVVGFVRRLDWFLLFAVAALVAYGLWAVAGITRFDVEGNESYYVVRQAIAAGLGFAGFLVALAIDPDRYRRAQKAIYGVTLLLMLLVFPLADTTRGSKRWIEHRPLPVPALRVRQAALRARARRLPRRPGRGGWASPRVVLQAIGLALVPIALVFKQPDLGTALVYGAALDRLPLRRRDPLDAISRRSSRVAALVLVERRLVPPGGRASRC